MEFEILWQNVVLAACACVGLIETLKSFFRTERKWLYAVIMIPLAVGCYASVLYLPAWVIGSALTVAVCQIGYQTIVQTFQAVIKRIGNKASGFPGPLENEVTDEAMGTV